MFLLYHFWQYHAYFSVRYYLKYFVLFSTLKKLMEQGKITAEYCQQANVAIAEKYGVSELSI